MEASGFAGGSSLAGLLLPGNAGLHSLLHVRFQHAEGGFVPLDAHGQRVQHPFGHVEVGDDPLGHRNRFGRYAERLRVEAEVDNHLFRHAGHTAEVRIRGEHLRVVAPDSRGLGLYGRGGAGGGLWRKLLVCARSVAGICHGMFLQVE